MKNIKYFFGIAWSIIQTFAVFRQQKSTPAMHRFCFLIVALIIGAIAIYIYTTPLFTTSNVALATLIGILCYFALSFRLFVLTLILTICLSLPGIYYVIADSDEVKAELSMLSTYGSIIRGTFDTTTDLSSGTLSAIANATTNVDVRNFFLNLSESVKNIKASGKESHAYRYTMILQRNLIMMLLIFSVLLSALTSYICVIFSHLEYKKYLEKFESENKQTKI